MSSSGLFSIRRLTPGDVALMDAMMAMFGDAFDEVDTYTTERPSREYLGRLLGAKHLIALAALKEDTVVGGLAAYELQKFERQRSEIYIYDLAVAAVHRREGIATALIDRLKTIAANLGAQVIFVQADRADTPALSLYNKLGACSEVLHFDIKIAGS
jgi:aminoglycoside 3-N-acetyltransferase I